MARQPVKNAVVNYDAELAALAQGAVDAEAHVGAGGGWLSFRGGRMSYQENPIADNTIDVVILDHTLENSMYKGLFNPNNPQSPVCFAIGRTAEEMVPHEDSEEAQAEACATCPNNQWGSADTGRGKACKNVRRVVCVLAESLDGDIATAETIAFRPPVTSGKAWANYVKGLGQRKLAPLQVMTRITLVPDNDDQFHLGFEEVGLVDPSHFPALLEKRKTSAVTETLFKPFEKNSEREPPPPPKGKGLKGRGVVPPAKGRR